MKVACFTPAASVLWKIFARSWRETLPFAHRLPATRLLVIIAAGLPSDGVGWFCGFYSQNKLLALIHRKKPILSRSTGHLPVAVLVTNCFLICFRIKNFCSEEKCLHFNRVNVHRKFSDFIALAIQGENMIGDFIDYLSSTSNNELFCSPPHISRRHANEEKFLPHRVGWLWARAEKTFGIYWPPRERFCKSLKSFVLHILTVSMQASPPKEEKWRNYEYWWYYWDQ